jgi:myosin-1
VFDSNPDNKKERTLFSDKVQKYDRSFKMTQRELILTDQHLFVIGAEKAKNGVNKGKYVKIVKRKIPLSKIKGVSLSTLADDFFLLHVADDYDNIFENILKTEFLTVLRYALLTQRNSNDRYRPSD